MYNAYDARRISRGALIPEMSTALGVVILRCIYPIKNYNRKSKDYVYENWVQYYNHQHVIAIKRVPVICYYKNGKPAKLIHGLL